ncbi:glycosyltransferase family 25 protein [Pontibacter locisalis]|uniref:Glycosyltransferase family 25 protein n=1 Tax=Pontibacter locisalis TaxID=1719035 RepID=A0ABW5IRP0_9BACT
MSFGETLNAFFDNIFVITLSRSKDRHEEIARELSKYNIKYSFIEGVDGWKLDLNSIGTDVLDKEKNLEVTRMPIAPGELGCSLSVLKVCKKIVKENLQRVLILQDDIRVISENIKHTESLLSAVTFPWDLLYLGHTNMFMEMPIGIKLRMLTIYPLRYLLNRKKHKKPSEIRNTFRRPYNKNWFIAGEHHGGYAYGVSFEGAKILIDAFSPVFAPDDLTFRYYIKKGKMKAFSPKHFLFDQRSDLQSVVGDRPSWKVDWSKS